MIRLLLGLLDRLNYAAALPYAAPSPGFGHPTPGNSPLPGEVDAKLGTLMGWGLRVFYVAAWGGMLLAGYRLWSAHRHGEDTNFKGLLLVFAGCLIVGAAGPILDFALF